MLQLHVTDDRGSVAAHTLDRLPFILGRSPGASLQLVAPGIWDEHASIDLVEVDAGRKRFVISALGESLLSVNGQVISSKELKIGDEIGLGALRIVASLAPAKQKKLSLQEMAVWAVLLAVVFAEALVIHVAK